MLCCVVLGSHFVYSGVRGKGYATVECWSGQVGIVVNKKTIAAQGGGLASVRVGGGGQLSYRAPGIEILKEKELVAPKY